MYFLSVFVTQALLFAEAARPQDKWHVNNADPFVPRLHAKPFAIEPLPEWLAAAQAGAAGVPEVIPNVYQSEIDHALHETLRRLVEGTFTLVSEPAPALEATPLVSVTTQEDLEAMIHDINEAGRVAIDLEHHGDRTFYGFTSLIQLSTEHADYILDPFELFDSLEQLNAFTTNPEIVKIFHGADSDVQWLQRDFGVYVVNMFDTGQAMRALKEAGDDVGKASLENALKTFIGVSTDKTHQSDDWRIRPLTAEMELYARTDTHYLLELAGKLEERLRATGGLELLNEAWTRSAAVARMTYKRPEPEKANELLNKPKLNKAHQDAIRRDKESKKYLARAVEWRSETARRIDDSRMFVFSNAACLRIAVAKPKTREQLTAALASTSPVHFDRLELTEELLDDLLAALNN